MVSLEDMSGVKPDLRPRAQIPREGTKASREIGFQSAEITAMPTHFRQRAFSFEREARAISTIDPNL
jgi:hypothetical protein